jgi:phenylacetate-CoA ligase
MYWIIDALKGGSVRKHFKDVTYLLETGKANSLALRRILVHARGSVGFYKSTSDKHDINDFPVVNKSIIKAASDQFISSEFSKDQLIRLTTSGSTGTPFTVFQDKNKKERNTADTMVFAKKGGYHFGQKLYYLKIWSAANKKSSLTKWMQNIETVDVLKLDDAKLEMLVSDFIKEKSTFGVIGYASALETLSRYCERLPVNIKTKLSSMISISESLPRQVKDNLSNRFSISVMARYSNVENGIFAQHMDSESEQFELNHASYYFEIFDINHDIVLEDGKTGRIVITDLYNFGMPMIRYDTGDIGSIVKDERTGKRVLSNLEGRKLDLI